MEFYFKDPTEIVGKTMEILSKQNFKDWEDFGQKIDSIAQKFAKSYKDSLVKQNKSFIDKYRNQPKKKSKTSEVRKDTSRIKY